MKTPISWLKEYVDINVSPEALAERLVAAGFEVEEIIRQADGCKNVVTGKITAIEPHANSNHLQICQLFIGKGTLQIVTGAQNVKVGDIVPVALDGAELPNGKKIFNGELRGVASYGMLCSGDELCLTEDDFPGAGVDGILILPSATKVGLDINNVVGTNDVILDVAVTANRPDCNSIIGIAREVAAVLGKNCKQPELHFRAEPDRVTNYIDVTVQDKELCPRYIAKAVKNIKIGPSPSIIRSRLKAVGLRPINNIVDITNYVLTEIGQPMHAFDQRELLGGRIIVRRAANGEHFTALDGSEHTLDNSMLVIADAEKPVALAGVMGGLNSGIKDDTNVIILESAKFARDNIRRTSRTLNLRSDSSQRFEKGIDLASQEIAANRALSLICQYGIGTIVSGVIDTYPEAVANREVVVSTKSINEILGIKVPYKRMLQILGSLQIPSVIKGKRLIASVPGYRDDIVGANDIAEEVIRIYGYNKIKSTLLKRADQTKGGKSVTQKYTDKLKNTLAGLGLSEVVTYSFISPKDLNKLNLGDDDKLRKTIPLLNPLGEDVSVMRTTLASNMLSVLSSNAAKGNKNCSFFEVAKVFLPHDLPLVDFPDEREKLAIGAYGKDMDFFTLKGIVQNVLAIFGIEGAKYEQAEISYMHPGRTGKVYLENTEIGYLGEVHPDTAAAYGLDERVYFAELDVADIYKCAVAIRKFKATPKYPAMTRDLAFVVRDTLTANELIKAIRKCTNDEITESVKVFDVYKGEGIKSGYMSIAVNVTFRSSDRTLTEAEVNYQIDRILRSLKRKFRARLR